MEIFEHCDAKLKSDEFRPRALFDRFNIEFLATTEGALDDLAAHDRIHQSDWSGRVVTTYRPDSVVDPEFEVLQIMWRSSPILPVKILHRGKDICERTDCDVSTL